MINDKDLNDARNAWGNGIILISKTFDEKGIEEATIIANKVSLPQNLIHDKAYAKKEHIINGMIVDGIATVKVFKKACPIPSLNKTSL